MSRISSNRGAAMWAASVVSSEPKTVALRFVKSNATIVKMDEDVVLIPDLEQLKTQSGAASRGLRDELRGWYGRQAETLRLLLTSNLSELLHRARRSRCLKQRRSFVQSITVGWNSDFPQIVAAGNLIDLAPGTFAHVSV